MKSLIAGHLEHISSKIFDEHHGEIASFVARRQGIYALYKNDRLYYVGLAKDLRNRVKYHLKDKHSKKWDTFSLFLIHKTEHLKELESLLIHIAEPKGNVVLGKFTRSIDLYPALDKLMEERDRQKREDTFKGARRKSRRKLKQKNKKRLTAPHTAPKGLVLHKLLSPGAQIKATYKGKEILATINEQGKILLNGKLFNSPTAAGKSIIDRSTVNGWRFWKYHNSEGKWVALAELLRKKA